MNIWKKTINEELNKLLTVQKENNDLIHKNKNSFIYCKKIKQIQMKIGNLWQICIGNWQNYVNLKQGHKSGLDVINKTDKTIMEIKNRYNTDNANSRKETFKKLVNFKKENPDYKLIYAVMNEDKKHEDGIEKIIVYENVQITYLSGNKLLLFVFGNYKNEVIEFLNKKLRKYFNITSTSTN